LNSEKGEPLTVSSVDLQKYIGLWYEIAKIPNSFQRSCACNTTATYKLREDGRIDVINRCMGNDSKGFPRCIGLNIFIISIN